MQHPYPFWTPLEMFKRFVRQTNDIQDLPDDGRIAFTLDPGGNFKLMNPVGERLTGYNCAELRQLNVLDLLPGTAVDDLRAQVKRSIRRRCGAVFEIEITTKNRR